MIFHSAKLIYIGSPIQKCVCRDFSTDRDHGEGFVLSEYRATSGAGKSKHIKSNRVDPAGDRRMERQLLCMCQNVRHVYKQVVN